MEGKNIWTERGGTEMASRKNPLTLPEEGNTKWRKLGTL